MSTPKQLSRKSVQTFLASVRGAQEVEEAVCVVGRGATSGRVRVKRAAVGLANQVHVCRGEPLVIHVPDEHGAGVDGWYVVPVSWQLKFARSNAKSAAQHASHAFDCMMFKLSVLEPSHAVAQKDLKQACLAAIAAAQDPVVRIMIKAITRARDAVANALIETLNEELDL